MYVVTCGCQFRFPLNAMNLNFLYEAVECMQYWKSGMEMIFKLQWVYVAIKNFVHSHGNFMVFEVKWNQHFEDRIGELWII